MLLSVTLSKPVKNIAEILGVDYTRIKIKRLVSSNVKNDEVYFVESFTEKQVFHKKISENALNEFLQKHEGTTFKACVERTEEAEIQILANKKGKITRLEKKIKNTTNESVTSSEIEMSGVSLKSRFLDFSRNDKESSRNGNSNNKSKNYILKEGSSIPFLVHLGIMTAQGKVISSKYDKFRQINRFLEFVDDILDDVLKIRELQNDNSPLRIVDFGSGKSYLTFAVHYFLTQIKKINCEVFGLDLKKDVIEYCQKMANELNLSNLNFAVGDISKYNGEKNPDIVVTLHACDTATDFALDYSIKRNVSAILSVPCCQHEINSQLAKSSVGEDSPFEPLLRFGLIKERFSALVTDAIRAELLEKSGYKVQILEFIDAENTPKNLLIRAVKNVASAQYNHQSKNNFSKLMSELKIEQTLEKLLK